MNVAPISSLAGWLLTVALHGGLLLAAAWSADRVFRLTPSARELIWRCALFGGVITASLQLLASTSPQEWRLALPATMTTETLREPTRPNAEEANSERTDAAPAAAQSVSMPAPDQATSATPSSRRTEYAAPAVVSLSFAARFLSRLPALVLLLWLAGAAIASLRLCVGLLNLRRALARAKPLATPVGLDLPALTQRAGLHNADLYTLPDIAGPFAFGRRIFMPDWALTTLAPGQLQAMLAHEFAHLVRRDPQWKLTVESWRALFWFLPFAGLAQRRLDELAELACDASAARHTGDARAVAECLAACAERHLDAASYTLTPAMAARGSALIQRIDRLLEGVAMSTTKPNIYLRAAAAAALTASAFGLPTVGFLDPVAHAQTPPQSSQRQGSRTTSSSSHSSVSISNSKNGESQQMLMTINDDAQDLTLIAKGKLEFTADESDIASLSPGGSASLEEKRDGTTRRLELTEHDGKLDRRYYVNRHEQPFDEGGRAWLAALLPRLIRDSGLGAEARVQRIYTSGGAAAVLAEIEQIHNDYVRGIYLGLLVDKGPLSPADLDRCMRLAGEIGGDYEKRQALAKIFATQKLDTSRQIVFLQQTSRIHGDYELAELLSSIFPKLDNSAEVRASWLDAATHIGADYERSRTLRTMLTRRDLSEHELADLLNAGANLGSDHERAELLIDIAKQARDVDAIAPAYVQSTLRIGSAHEHAQTLLALINAGKLGTASANAVLDSTAKIGGNYERSQVLMALARAMPDDAALVARYHEVASHLSEYERGQAESALRR
ncbi:MAG: hypothetical protein J0I77_16010 [Rudaea sp.]|uniref:M56 family metallopeptidase n=1 Tax=unclassified Rudaea TaxID=2627037 RepID=UPI0010F85FD0|nr:MULTISPECIES: M56 family metallopeptidase [unclassified Rudaea]MBN8887228.1 hypothetical protein [Rudaea sp.]